MNEALDWIKLLAQFVFPLAGAYYGVSARLVRLEERVQVAKEAADKALAKIERHLEHSEATR